ncbi:MAG: hypothetical protein IJL87_08225 [Clostridia bacterium]|nr:hypothetical protein [Clostridia bacterium]
MKRLFSISAAVLICFLLFTSCSSGKKNTPEFKTVKNLGISFEYPGDWTYSYTDGESKMSVFKEGAKDFADNLNIIVDLEDENLRNYSEALFTNAYSKSFEDYKPDAFRTYNHFLGEDDDTYAIELRASYTNSEKHTVYFRQYILNQNGRNYVLTFSTLRRQFPSAFEHIMETLKFYE